MIALHRSSTIAANVAAQDTASAICLARAIPAAPMIVSLENRESALASWCVLRCADFVTCCKAKETFQPTLCS